VECEAYSSGVRSDSNFNPPPNFGGLILKILNVFLRLKLSPFLVLNPG
jgi:hypothetical protein